MAYDAGSQHTVSMLTVNTVKTVSWLALAVLGSVFWHDEVMTADEFLSVLSVFGKEKVSRCTAVSHAKLGCGPAEGTRMCKPCHPLPAVVNGKFMSWINAMMRTH